MTGQAWWARIPASRITVVLTAVAALAVNLSPARTLIPDQSGQLVIVLLVAGLTAFGSLAAFMLSRLDDSRGIAGLAAAVTVYALVVLPATVVAFTGDSADHLMSVLRASGALVFLVLMTFALVPRQPAWTTGWQGSLLGVVTSVALAMMIVATPPLNEALIVTGALVRVLIVAWTGISAVYMYYGLRNRLPLAYRFGGGMLIVAVAQVLRETGNLGLGSMSLRLLGAVIMCAALARSLRERFSTSQLRVDRIAELDHELHNVLAGLDGMTHVLSHAGKDDRELLSEAVREEIGRLRNLLDQRSEPPGCAVDPVLTRIVTLRRTNGLDVELDVEPGLRTTMPADAFAQVVTNLLANCERHAPGAKVQVKARANGRSVHVEVRDDGPGLAPEVRGKVFRRGVHDRTRGGSGLGLHLSQQLVGASGGSLSLRPGVDGHGTVAALAVPAGRP
ncbi:sensor histidine kinase [Kutzneria kofuensis]|uniref:histidine kinase n=1 Tax=Kutzneria kofuensis TaxID=103725 RepID=A0A7W9KJQ5_9PSEU|nr:HAMP domain-containing sensor histidine kinase [Kutzneria kofuensis]MBB5893835.1 two-component system OmpR family sensor kinase [Kutzneria kofuensis]